MRFVKPALLAALLVTLTAYGVDCGAMTTPDQAMQCCKSMSCSSHGHDGHDCCKTMTAMHAPFVQTSLQHGISHAPLVVAVLAASNASPNADSHARAIAALCHAPPVLHSIASTPLRI